MHTNWQDITSLAYLTLLELDIHEFPISTKKIGCIGVRIISYQDYSRKTGLPISKITLDHELDDAFLVKGLRPNLTLILYDNDKYKPRMKHTLWHEIGHIKCEHTKHGDHEEIEAHFFASQAIAPNVIIKAISERGYTINAKFLMECFGISKEAAKKKMQYFDKYQFTHTNEYDKHIIAQFSEYINKQYPFKTNLYHDDYYDEMENERNNWY